MFTATHKEAVILNQLVYRTCLFLRLLCFPYSDHSWPTCLWWHVLRLNSDPASSHSSASIFECNSHISHPINNRCIEASPTPTRHCFFFNIKIWKKRSVTAFTSLWLSVPKRIKDWFSIATVINANAKEWHSAGKPLFKELWLIVFGWTFLLRIRHNISYPRQVE